MNRLGSLFRRKSEPTQFSAPEEDEQSIARVVSADYLAVHGSREDAAHGECIRQSSVGCETDPLMDSSSSSSCSQDEIHKNTHADGFGDKSISMFGGFCLLANNITGPGMIQFACFCKISNLIFSFSHRQSSYGKHSGGISTSRMAPVRFQTQFD